MTGLGLKTIRKIEQDDQSVSMHNVNFLLNFFGLELSPRKLLVSPNGKGRSKLSKDDILKTLRGLLPIFKIKFNISQLGLFGSFAREENQSTSDVDILFQGETNFSNEGEMTLILEHLFKGYSIDLTNKNYLDPRIEESILEDVIYV